MTGILYLSVGYPAALFVRWLEKRSRARLQRQDARMIELIDIHKRFGDVEVLQGVSLAVKPGEVICIIGPSGSGKSTLLRCINYLEQPSCRRDHHRREQAYYDVDNGG